MVHTFILQNSHPCGHGGTERPGVPYAVCNSRYPSSPDASNLASAPPVFHSSSESEQPMQAASIPGCSFESGPITCKIENNLSHQTYDYYFTHTYHTVASTVFPALN
jgi:hypothetical protein